MLKYIVILLILVSALFVVVISLPPIYRYKWMLLTFLDWKITERIEKKMENDQNELLMKKIKSCDFLYAQIAAHILGQRKEKKIVPLLIRYTKSPFNFRREMAVAALGEIGDQRAIEPLMKIIRRGQKNNNYIDALYALSKMRHEAILPLVIEIAKSKDADRAHAVSMLKEFGKKEAMPILHKIAEEDEEDYIRENAKEAINAIESLQSREE